MIKDDDLTFLAFGYRIIAIMFKVEMYIHKYLVISFKEARPLFVPLNNRRGPMSTIRIRLRILYLIIFYTCPKYI